MQKTTPSKAGQIIRDGGLVAFPTETVYGLGANALDPAAVLRIYRTKGRPSTSPLIVHTASREAARELASEWPESAEVLASRFWPGPLTLVVPKKPLIPDVVTAGLPTVGLRVPSHPVALEFLREAGVPVAAPSANRFTELSPTKASHVALEADAVLEGGDCEVGIESTVVSLAGEPVLLRPGMISLAELEEALGREVRLSGEVKGAHPSPGMHRKHYSPRTKVMLVTDGMLPEGRGAYLWFRTPAEAAFVVAMPEDAGEYARKLYDALHEADARDLEWIAVEMPPEEGTWAGIRDRLKRAAY